MPSAPYQYDPTAFEPTAMGPLMSVCLRCGLAVAPCHDENLAFAQMRHHSWHVALDGALANSGAHYGALADVSSIKP